MDANALALALKVDRFIFDYDPYEYNDNGTTEDYLPEILDDLVNNDAEVTLSWLGDVVKEDLEAKLFQEMVVLLDEISEFQEQQNTLV